MFNQRTDVTPVTASIRTPSARPPATATRETRGMAAAAAGKAAGKRAADVDLAAADAPALKPTRKFEWTEEFSALILSIIFGRFCFSSGH